MKASTLSPLYEVIMNTRQTFLLSIFCLSVASGCFSAKLESNNGDDSPDAGMDTPVDAVDGSKDSANAGTDASKDERGVDASPDADASKDAQADALEDAVEDEQVDAQTDETPDMDPPVAGPSINGPEHDYGAPAGGCVPGVQPSGKVRVCVDFDTGVQSYEVPGFNHSFGQFDPPAGTVFADPYAPTPGTSECSVQTHDRYWVQAQNGRVYRTWHPPQATDVVTGQPCNFGHEHGDDPRESPLYYWAGGVPFGIVNDVSKGLGYHRHEDHYGHKVVVQNKYEVMVGNGAGPDDEVITNAEFFCYWLSKVHQGTHSGDALRHNMHEYQNNVFCDDGFARHPDAGFTQNAGPDRHTRSSVKTLTFWGQPGWFKSCDGLDPLTVGDPATDGFEPPEDSDTNREIKCATSSSGWSYKDFPTEVVSPTGDPDFAPRNGGIDELWKPWMNVITRTGDTIFTSSAYYIVRNPIRLYNDGSLVPRRDVNGDGVVDNWIPTLEFCLALGRNYGQCDIDPSIFPSNVPADQWWKLPQSPYNGTIRIIHPKTIDMSNKDTKSVFCTDHMGRETMDNATPDANGMMRCPTGQLLQRVAATANHWNTTRAEWGAKRARGNLTGSMINARSATQGAGYGHEWVRFFDAPGIHSPN